MFSALLWMTVNLLRIWILRVKFLRYVFPFVPRLGVFPELDNFYFSSLIRISSSCSDQLWRVILCLLRLSHLKRHDSGVVPGMSEEISSQLSLMLWISATLMLSLWQCLQIIQMSILRSQTLQFLLSLRVLAILNRKGHTFKFVSLSIELLSHN